MPKWCVAGGARLPSAGGAVAVPASENSGSFKVPDLSPTSTSPFLMAPDAIMQGFDDVVLAFRQACLAAGDDDRIVAFGSFYTVADVMRALPGDWRLSDFELAAANGAAVAVGDLAQHVLGRGLVLGRIADHLSGRVHADLERRDARKGGE